MSDDTQQPFAGHGFAFSEPYPLNAADRIAALERQVDVLRDERERISAVVLRRGELLAAWRQAAHEMRFGSAMIDRTTDELGDARSIWYEQAHLSVPIQGGD